MLTQEQRAFTEYDPFAENFYDDAPRVYRWMRDEAPVYYSQKRGFWALSRYQDVRAAVKDAQTFLNFEGIDTDDTAKAQSGPGFLSGIVDIDALEIEERLSIFDSRSHVL